MLSLLSWFLPKFPGWLTLEANPLDSLLQGVICACGIFILCDLTRLHVFLENQSGEGPSEQRTPTPQRRAKSRLGGMLQFWVLTGLLALVASRVASLVVLEFSLRTISAWVTAGPESRGLLQLIIQCQFSLGCALSCSLHFIHEGAPQRWLSLLLGAALSWFLARQTSRLQHHVLAMYTLHSSQRYCGVCISLLTAGGALLPLLRRTLLIIFSVAVIASTSMVNRHFLSATEALKFWTPLTICYTMLVVYMQEEQHRDSAIQNILKTVAVRLGGLLFLMLTIGRWADVFHIIICFLGEAVCLIPTRDLLDSASLQDEEDFKDYKNNRTLQKRKRNGKEHSN